MFQRARQPDPMVILIADARPLPPARRGDTTKPEFSELKGLRPCLPLFTLFTPCLPRTVRKSFYLHTLWVSQRLMNDCPRNAKRPRNVRSTQPKFTFTPIGRILLLTL